MTTLIEKKKNPMEEDTKDKHSQSEITKGTKNLESGLSHLENWNVKYFKK